MTREEAVARIQEGLGFRSDRAETIVLRLQEAQRELERGKTLPRFLISENQSLAITQGSSTIALPSDFLRRTDTKPRYQPSLSDRFQFIPWRNFEDAYKAYSNATASGPKVITLRNTTLYFFPVADRAYTLTWDYYIKDALLTTNIENLWLREASDLMIGFAGTRIARDMRNKTGAELFGTMYQEARLAWFNDTVVQEADDEICLGSDN